ncbi:hypothetical protein [Virgibacillus salexigens]|uniref:hypothetical protein n=1 Tax=Virgibacillus salexigens TaxID=61016 RepID=UPI00190A21F4|nr:hypothetical protein [Virgibacillus salexigens]
MNKTLIKKYIAIPMAIKVFSQDLEKFKSYKMRNVYLDKLDAVIDQLQNDLNDIKKQIYTVHHINVRRIDKCKYKANNEIIEFTPDEMREMTKVVMQEYLYGSEASEFQAKERMWPDQI